jgi:proteasome lid subunit RPN8/RPN11
LRLNLDWLRVLVGDLLAAAPEEGCALLLGKRLAAGPGAGLLELALVWPCLNRWQPGAERRQRFLIDPREQLQAQRWARQRGVQVLGSAHSHPTSPAEPSATDLAMAVAPTLMVIRSGLVGSGVVGQSPDPLAGLGAWWLPGDGVAPLALEIQVTP